MTAKLTPQTRVLAILGLVLVVAFAAMMVMRGGLSGSSSDDVAAPVRTPSTPTIPGIGDRTTTAPARPKRIAVLPGVPSPVASALQRSRVVVAALVGGASADRTRVAEARAGAKSVGAAFVTLDVRKESQARAVSTFLGKGTSATVLVVRRPGKVANSFSAYADRAIIAQAAVNAGAKPKATAAKRASRTTADKAAARRAAR